MRLQLSSSIETTRRQLPAPPAVAAPETASSFRAQRRQHIKYCFLLLGSFRYVDNYFSEDHGNVNGTDYAIKRVNVNGTEVLLQLWDIAGQARFGASASRVYYKEALGAVLVYECSRPKTFDSAAKVSSVDSRHL